MRKINHRQNLLLAACVLHEHGRKKEAEAFFRQVLPNQRDFLVLVAAVKLDAAGFPNLAEKLVVAALGEWIKKPFRWIKEKAHHVFKKLTDWTKSTKTVKGPEESKRVEEPVKTKKVEEPVKTKEEKRRRPRRREEDLQRIPEVQKPYLKDTKPKEKVPGLQQKRRPALESDKTVNLSRPALRPKRVIVEDKPIDIGKLKQKRPSPALGGGGGGHWEAGHGLGHGLAEKGKGILRKTKGLGGKLFERGRGSSKPTSTLKWLKERAPTPVSLSPNVGRKERQKQNTWNYRSPYEQTKYLRSSSFHKTLKVAALLQQRGYKELAVALYLETLKD